MASKKPTENKSALKKPNMSDPYYLHVARAEMRESRKVGILTVVLIIVSLMFMFTMYSSMNKDKQISYLSNNRIMFGFANDDGVFVSSDKRPDSMVLRYAKEFVLNYYTFDPESIKTNIEAARGMMDYRSASRNTEVFQERIRSVKKDTLSQMFIPRRSKIEDMNTHYIVTLQGSLDKFASSISTGRTNLEVKVKVNKVPLTEDRQEGLSIAGVTDQQIARI